jgi:acyl carrier protein
MDKIDPEEFLDAVAAAVEGADRSDLSLSLPVKDIPGWDSMARLSVVAEMEERFGSDIGFNDLAACETILAIKERVESRRTPAP